MSSRRVGGAPDSIPTPSDLVWLVPPAGCKKSNLQIFVSKCPDSTLNYLVVGPGSPHSSPKLAPNAGTYVHVKRVLPSVGQASTHTNGVTNVVVIGERPI